MRALAVCLLALESLSHVSGDVLGSNDRVLVATGFIQGDGLENARTSEVVDVTAGEDKTCKSLDQAPNNRWASIGGVLNGRPLICGGFNGTDSFRDCFWLGPKPDKIQVSLSQIRSFATSLVMTDAITGNDYMWVVGGYYEADLSTTEFVYADGRASASGPELDFPVAHHCMVQVDYDAIYIIGGKQNGNMTNKVWIVDPTNSWSVTEGPSLLNDRYFHSCAVMETGPGKRIVVAGGFGSDGAPETSVETLDAFTSNGWKKGPSFPTSNLFAGQMVTGNSGSVIAVAGNNAVLELSEGSTQWNKLKDIQYGRMMPVVLNVPEEITNCN